MNPSVSSTHGLGAYEAMVEEALQHCGQASEIFESEVAREMERLQAGFTLAEARGISHAQCESLYDAVVYLMAQARHGEALSPALVLASHAPADGRFTFAAACCLQATDRHAQAIPLYSASILAKPGALAAFRLGECLAAVGMEDEALQCFDSVPRHGDVAQHPELAAAADAAAVALRNGNLRN